MGEHKGLLPKWISVVTSEGVGIIKCGRRHSREYCMNATVHMDGIRGDEVKGKAWFRTPPVNWIPLVQWISVLGNSHGFMHQDQDDSFGIELNAKKEAVYTILNESRSPSNQRGSDPQNLKWLGTDWNASDPLYGIQLIGTILHEWLMNSLSLV